MTYTAIMNDGDQKSKVIAFIDDNRSLQGKRINSIPVISQNKAFQKVIPQNDISELIIAISEPVLNKASKRKIVDLCIKNGIVIKEVPAVSQWIEGGINVKQFKNVKIEDLLGRDTIHLDKVKIREGVQEATILVTGAAGSIGSEIVRQLVAFNAKKVLLLDQAESASYDLENELKSANSKASFKVIICDVTNAKKLRKIFEKHSPNIVFNAAAYKHVPLMEEHPCEALRVNIGGTKVLADLSIEYGVEKFVYISTDKAVNPSSVMGASKRISEIYIQSLSQKNGSTTKFITTRFGNVLGSNGSVIPLFRKQIEAGGPLTVTHKNITRFFMTIPEACQLVLEAGFMAKGGEIFMFEMGEPIKIYSLAEKMIALSGLVPHKDIEIKITGLRPGEKLYEELLTSQEQLMPTHNDKIMIGKFQKHNYDEVNNAVCYLIDAVDDLSKHDLVARMKKIVPEYISMNSVHCCLDKAIDLDEKKN
jgi:FlaA1/EpsC-like NDP-sugar epimerase